MRPRGGLAKAFFGASCVLTGLSFVALGLHQGRILSGNRAPHCPSVPLGRASGILPRRVEGQGAAARVAPVETWRITPARPAVAEVRVPSRQGPARGSGRSRSRRKLWLPFDSGKYRLRGREKSRIRKFLERYARASGSFVVTGFAKRDEPFRNKERLARIRARRIRRYLREHGVSRSRIRIRSVVEKAGERVPGSGVVLEFLPRGRSP